MVLPTVTYQFPTYSKPDCTTSSEKSWIDVLPTTIGNSINFLSKIRQHAARLFSSSVFFTNGTPADTDANELLLLEDELTRYYFAEHITGPLSLNKEDISTLGKCPKNAGT